MPRRSARVAEHGHRRVRSFAQDRLERVATDDQAADAVIALGDDRRGAGRLAQHGQLADVVARLVPADEVLGAVRIVVDHPDRPLDDDHELVADVALANERLARRVEMLLGGRGDALEVLGVEAFEDRHATQRQHRVEVVEDVARLGHVRPS